jgi:hypothetical protein
MWILGIDGAFPANFPFEPHPDILVRFPSLRPVAVRFSYSKPPRASQSTKKEVEHIDDLSQKAAFLFIHDRTYSDSFDGNHQPQQE